ncbi:MAG: sugar phosphate isomerase/epimerase [Methanomassiliicoccales archaeon]|nr:sugar phosphate isomerase/epimerase [Methanomassiliicoccales archaeon]
MLHVTLGLNAATIRQADLITGLCAAKEAGFVGYEPWVSDFHTLSKDQRVTIKRLCNYLSLKWLPLMGIQNFFVDNANVIRKSELVFSLAAEMEIPVVTVVPGQFDQSDKFAIDEATKELHKLLDKAKMFGIELFFEMVAFHKRPFNNLKKAIALAERAEIKLVIDTFHLAVSRATPEEIAKLSPELIGLVHLSDAVVKEQIEELADEDRVLPGEGNLKLVEILRALRKTNYQGAVSVEVFHPKYADKDAYTVAKEAYKKAKEVLEAAGW